MSNGFTGCVCMKKCILFESHGKTMPEGCAGGRDSEVVRRSIEECQREGSEARMLWQAFTRLVGHGGASRSRLEHILEFSHSAGFKRIGVACCAKFLPQAQLVAAKAREFGFESMVAACKLGSIHFDDFDLVKDSDWILCNPLAQAYGLNDFGSDINVTLGLCMGHDILFGKYSDVYVTNLVTKEWISEDAPLKTLEKVAQGEYELCPYMTEEVDL